MSSPSAPALVSREHQTSEIDLKSVNNQDLDITLKTTDSGRASGGSSIGSHSPPHPDNSNGQIVDHPPNSGPPPRHLLPAKLKPSPPVKMHPAGVILNVFKGKGCIFWLLRLEIKIIKSFRGVH